MPSTLHSRGFLAPLCVPWNSGNSERFSMPLLLIDIVVVVAPLAFEDMPFAWLANGYQGNSAWICCLQSEVVRYSFTRRIIYRHDQGRPRGLGGIRGGAARVLLAFRGIKALNGSSRLAVGSLQVLLSARCHGCYISSQYGIKSATVAAADVVCKIIYGLCQAISLLPARSFARMRVTG